MLDTRLQAQVAADVEFARLARGDAGGGPERRLPTLPNAARAALVALGFQRRAKDVSDHGFGDTLNLDGVGGDHLEAIKEHERLRRLCEEAMDYLAERVEKKRPGLLSTMCATDQREWLRRLLAKNSGPVAKNQTLDPGPGFAYHLPIGPPPPLLLRYFAATSVLLQRT